MRSGIFGWSLPPGVSMRDIDPGEGPCDVCGQAVDDCICPECPECGTFGDPKCYDGKGGEPSHGLVRTAEQIEGRKALEEAWAAYAAAESAAYADIPDDIPDENE